MLDVLIKNGTLLTMDAKRSITSDHVYIKDGIIVGMGSEERPARTVIDASGHVVLPGLINCHTHIYQALIEGIGYDMHFEPWNWRFLFPIVSQMTPEHSYRSARLAALEMIRTGTTTVSDHWYMHTDFMNIREATRALDEMGIRAKMIYGLLDQTFAGQTIDTDKMTMVHTRDELEKDFKRYFDQWHNRGAISVAIGAGSTQDASEDLLTSSKRIADTLGILVSTHVAGWQDILTSSYSRFGMRDVEFTHSRGLTGKNALFIHTVWMSPDEISMLSESGTSSVHCPAANSQLGYGIAPVPEMLQAGVHVGLGTDGAGSYTYDMFEQMRLAAYLQKQKHQSADALTAEQALEMATIGGAAALGMSDEIGSLETGKKADVILIDFNQPHLMLTGRLVPKLVYSAHGSDVTGVVVNGRPLMVGRKLLDINEAVELEQAHTVYTQLLEKAGEETFRLLKAPWGGKQPYWREKV